MSKKFIISVISIFALLLMVNCQEDNFSFGDVTAPSNLKVTTEIMGVTVPNPNGDGSGKVKFTALADNAISYKFIFGDGTSASSPNGVFSKTYSTPGVNTYTVIILASGKGGVTTSISKEITVFSDFKDDEAIKFLTGPGGSEKKWYWAAVEDAHLGVGPNVPESDATFGANNFYPSFYAAGAFDKSATCLYGDVLTFSVVGNVLKYNLNNQGQTFFNKSYFNLVGGSGDQDKCYPYDTSGLKTVQLVPTESYVAMNAKHEEQTRGTSMSISDGGFMGYYIGATTYEIMSITANRMTIRAVQGNNDFLAWYFTFSTSPPVPADDTPPYTVLKFSDEFNTDGAPDPAKWAYDLGNGNSGWGNGELQNYTNLAKNVKVEGGSLKITAIKEFSSGFNYSSARLKTEGIYNFDHGTVEFRAKMPTGGGTWPAVWSLGSDHLTNIWPACGEIDFMEHIGNQQNKIFGTLHYPEHSGGAGNQGQTTVANASDWHVYKVFWTTRSITFYVDGIQYHQVSTTNLTQFHSNFFMIMDVAMGGGFGGAIDPAFSQSTLEVDYIRVYQ